MRVRAATPADVPGMIAVKEALRLRPEAPDAGGFLLGTDAAGYTALIAVGHVRVAEHDGAVVGFGVAMPDAVVRGSELWHHRAAIRWEPDVPWQVWEGGRVGYFDQLAVLPSFRADPGTLALAAATAAAVADADVVFTTTVRVPVTNRAAWALIARMGGRRVGELDEVYPGVGRIVSDLHAWEGSELRSRLAAAIANRGYRRVWAKVDPALHPS